MRYIIRESSRMRRASPSAKFANRIFSGVRPRLRLIASAAPFGVGRTGKNAGEFFGSSLHVYVFRFSVSDFRFWLDGWVGWMWKRSTQITQTQALRPCESEGLAYSHADPKGRRATKNARDSLSERLPKGGAEQVRRTCESEGSEIREDSRIFFSSCPLTTILQKTDFR